MAGMLRHAVCKIAVVVTYYLASLLKICVLCQDLDFPFSSSGCWITCYLPSSESRLQSWSKGNRRNDQKPLYWYEKVPYQYICWQVFEGVPSSAGFRQHHSFLEPVQGDNLPLCGLSRWQKYVQNRLHLWLLAVQLSAMLSMLWNYLICYDFFSYFLFNVF